MITNDDMDVVFHALAHVHRRKMMDIIRAKPGAAVGELAANFDVSRISVMQHLAVLERAELITSRKDGSRRLLYINTVPLQEIHERWTSSYTHDGARRVLDIQRIAEATARKQKDTDND